MPSHYSSENKIRAIPNLIGFGSDSNAPHLLYRDRRSHDGRYSICTETGALRSSTPHHLGTRPQAPHARRFALLFQFTVVVSRFTLLRYTFTEDWLAICTNERARPSLPSGRGGLSSSGCFFVSVSRQTLMSELGLSQNKGIEDF